MAVMEGEAAIQAVHGPTIEAAKAKTRDVIALALRASLQNDGPHLGPFLLPAHFDDV